MTRKARFHAWLRYCLQPGLDRIEHLLRHRAPEARDPGGRHGVTIADRADGVRVSELRSHKLPGLPAGQPEIHRLRAFVVRVVQDGDGDRFRRLARRYREARKNGDVIFAGRRSPVIGAIPNFHVVCGRRIDRDDEVERCARRLLDFGIRDGHAARRLWHDRRAVLRSWRDRRARPALEVAPVTRADGVSGFAIVGAAHAQRHVFGERARLHRDLPAEILPSHEPARLRDGAARDVDEVVADRLVAEPRRRFAEAQVDHERR